MPTEDKFLTTRGQLKDPMAMTLGGRAAEELVFSEITTGAANDLEKVTSTAKQMTMRFGMSEKLGPRVLGHNQGAPFLGRDMQQSPTTPTTWRARSTPRSAASSRRPTSAPRHAHRAPRGPGPDLPDPAQRETIERDEFVALLAGEPEEDVFREKDEKRGQQGDSESKPQRPSLRPHVGAPAPVSPIVPRTT